MVQCKPLVVYCRAWLNMSLSQWLYSGSLWHFETLWVCVWCFTILPCRRQINRSHWQSNIVKILTWLQFWKAGMFENVQITMGKHLDTEMSDGPFILVERRWTCLQTVLLSLMFWVCFILRIFKSWTMLLQSNQIPFVQREAQISSQKTKNVASTKIAPIWGTLPEEIGESKWWNWVRMAILLGWQRWQAECWLVVCWCYWQWEGFILSLPVVKTIRQTKHYGIMKHKK